MLNGGVVLSYSTTAVVSMSGIQGVMRASRKLSRCRHAVLSGNEGGVAMADHVQGRRVADPRRRSQHVARHIGGRHGWAIQRRCELPPGVVVIVDSLYQLGPGLEGQHADLQRLVGRGLADPHPLDLHLVDIVGKLA